MYVMSHTQNNYIYIYIYIYIRGYPTKFIHKYNNVTVHIIENEQFIVKSYQNTHT